MDELFESVIGGIFRFILSALRYLLFDLFVEVGTWCLESLLRNNSKKSAPLAFFSGLVAIALFVLALIFAGNFLYPTD
ncbi:hypothetical protein BCT46_07120 [Vibrio sp. 10N.261.46.E8]|nr:hypothetical protein BH584_03810 [Vibrio sp. 10N.261.45.E1]PMJ22083.1 hypothetical protein BCU27_16850 [Vibrio sp. 10N.286.45.B6]PMM76605.1 hypothetical protein BCT48_02205 [Vibrio sp. 10N.261.46.F12]PMM86929.1 hypothetical protein BCT46_07120 [Vibrio sp. 10N.261.46.E8]PMN77300.1 hypothetical protein BCT22_21280 [Vibrio sp. 10N.261.45.A1]PMN79503.1 hypothetical protein BCT25_16170 [Vibrio sp. 10N.261.45.A6]